VIPDWLDDLLLESVAPPSNWLGTRAQRLADARLTLRRRFGAAREAPAARSHALRDLGGAHPLFAGSRIVGGDEIEADLELEITSINPPVVQGWIVAAGVIVFIAELLLMKQLFADAGASAARGFATVVVVPLVWLALIALVGWFERDVELDEGGVAVRRWTDRWLRHPGLRLGQPNDLTARLDGRFGLVLASPQRTIRASTRLWSQTARQDLVDELPLWGVDCTFDHHRHRPDRPGRRRRHRERAAAVATERAHRPD
jgi:hypothetical protein